MKKGFIEEISWTIFLGIFAVAMLLVAAFAYIGLVFTQTDINSMRIEFVNVIKSPYDIGHALANFRARERPFIEHAIDMITTKEKAGKPLTDDVKKFMDTYGFKHYSIEVIDAKGDKYFELDNTKRKCGSNDNGICTSGDCNVGMVGTEDLKCQAGQECCQYNETRYKQLLQESLKEFSIVKCGNSLNGYCNMKCNDDLSIKIDDNKLCEKANGGRTTVCCAPVSTQGYSESWIGGSAQIPVLYRGRMLYDSKKNYNCQGFYDKCAGTKVLGLCQEGEACCVTDIINCKPNNDPKTETYACMRADECGDLGGTPMADDDLCPSGNTFRCCKGVSTLSEMEGDMPKITGTCNLGGQSYYSSPVIGYIEIMVSDK